MSKTISCAIVVGLGNIAIRHRRNLKMMFPGVKIVAVSSSGRMPDSLPENADLVLPSVAKLGEIQPDFAIVASPSPFHLEHCRAFMQYNIPILVEKPVTANEVDANLFNQSAQLYHPPIGVGYCLRFLPSAHKVKTILDSGDLGRINTVMSEVGQFLPDWRRSKNYRDSVSASRHLGGGALLELSHELDYLKWFFGELSLKHAHTEISNILSLEVEDVANIYLSSEKVSSIFVHLDFLQRTPKRHCSIIGENGRIDWDLRQNKVSWYIGDEQSQEFRLDGWDYNNMYIELISAILFGDKAGADYCRISEGISTVRLIEEIKLKTKGS